MQWQYQVRAPGLLDGMAISLAKEALRTLQDALPIHKTLLAKYATKPTYSCLLPASHHSYCQKPGRVAEVLPCGICLAGLFALGHETHMGFLILVW